MHRCSTLLSFTVLASKGNFITLSLLSAAAPDLSLLGYNSPLRPIQEHTRPRTFLGLTIIPRIVHTDLGVKPAGDAENRPTDRIVQNNTIAGTVQGGLATGGKRIINAGLVIETWNQTAAATATDRFRVHGGIVDRRRNLRGCGMRVLVPPRSCCGWDHSRVVVLNPWDGEIRIRQNCLGDRD
jgi:hypothetical protein